MSPQQASESKPLQTTRPVFEILADERRRRILDVLVEHPVPVSEEALTLHLAAVAQETPPRAISESELQALRADAVHVQLPTLADAGLIEWDEDAGTVTTADHPALRDPKFERILETEAEGWDEVLASLAHRRRRIALSVLVAWEGPMTRADLAREIATVEGDDGADDGAVEDLRVSLHHGHLPKLDRAGLVAYDADDGTVSYEGHPALPDEWLDVHGDETPGSVLPTA